jgi:hypothetical protein
MVVPELEKLSPSSRLTRALQGSHQLSRGAQGRLQTFSGAGGLLSCHQVKIIEKNSKMRGSNNEASVAVQEAQADVLCALEELKSTVLKAVDSTSYRESAKITLSYRMLLRGASTYKIGIHRMCSTIMRVTRRLLLLLALTKSPWQNDFQSPQSMRKCRCSTPRCAPSKSPQASYTCLSER